VSPLTSSRISHSSGPLNGGGSLSDSPPVSPDINDTKVPISVCVPGSSVVAKSVVHFILQSVHDF
jgi:hypothetical protein